ncbi:MAG TPA: hypothetical protein VE641_13530, partial [Chthoniobacterales bacterium]|nr:hypothetical protein [Chthoniobacterales bacterium]
ESTKRDHDVIRRFSSSGELISTALRRSTFKSKTHPAQTTVAGTPYLLASDDRVGVYSPAANEWIEFGMSGELLLRLPVSLPTATTVDGQNTKGRALTIASVAMTGDGSVFAWLQGGSNAGLYELDREDASWIRVNGPITESRLSSFGWCGGK